MYVLVTEASGLFHGKKSKLYSVSKTAQFVFQYYGYLPKEKGQYYSFCILSSYSFYYNPRSYYIPRP